MRIDEITANNFIESLKLAQRMFNCGLLISFLAVFVAFKSGGVGDVKVPFIDMSLDSKENFITISAFFFLVVGVYMNFAIKRCGSLIKKIESPELAEAVKNYPSIVNANFLYTTIMVVSLGAVWAATITQVYGIQAIYGVVLANIIITPYIHGARSSRNITPKNG